MGSSISPRRMTVEEHVPLRAAPLHEGGRFNYHGPTPSSCERTGCDSHHGVPYISTGQLLQFFTGGKLQIEDRLRSISETRH